MAAPSSAHTRPSPIATSAPASHPSVACGPCMVCSRRGIVRNGPTPTMARTLIVVAERKPSRRSSAGEDDEALNLVFGQEFDRDDGLFALGRFALAPRDEDTRRVRQHAAVDAAVQVVAVRDEIHVAEPGGLERFGGIRLRDA